MSDSLVLDHENKKELDSISTSCLEELKSTQDNHGRTISKIRDQAEQCLIKDYLVCLFAWLDPLNSIGMINLYIVLMITTELRLQTGRSAYRFIAEETSNSSAKLRVHWGDENPCTSSERRHFNRKQVEMGFDRRKNSRCSSDDTNKNSFYKCQLKRKQCLILAKMEILGAQ